MVLSDSKSQVQISGPTHTFPFTAPHVSQWCRFTVPSCRPLLPFRQDRLHPLPLLPGVMATGKVMTFAGTESFHQLESREAVEPQQKILQLEKSLVFVRENHALLLKGLHEEIAELKQKNRELLFELVTGMPALPKDPLEDQGDRESPKEKQYKIEKLEKEVRKLRGALRDAMKANSSLSNQLHDIKREHCSQHSAHNQAHTQKLQESVDEDERHTHSPCGPSPQMEEYSNTLRQIQGATLRHSATHDERQCNHQYHEGAKSEWVDNFSKSGIGYHRHHHHHRSRPQKSPQQPRLPRLPLQNQQNYSHPQYEIQYRQRSSNSLPALKPLVPVVERGLDKSRKSRGSRPAKITDHVIKG